MTRAEVVKRLQAGEELVYAIGEGAYIGTVRIRWPQYCKLLSEGKIREQVYRDHQHFYRWSGPTPAAGTATPPTP